METALSSTRAEGQRRVAKGEAETPRLTAIVEADAVAAVRATPAITDASESGATVLIEDGPSPFDEATESEFRAEAKGRGEAVSAPPATPEIEETEAKNLPPLDALVQRIPAEVREALDELFRAKFVRVQRVPKRALKS